MGSFFDIEIRFSVNNIVMTIIQFDKISSA